MKQQYINLKLRWRLSILITSVAIYTALTIALSVYYLWTEQIKTQVSTQLQKVTETTVKSLNKEIAHESNNLKAWAQLDVMLDVITGDVDKRIINTLELLKKNYQLAGELIVIDSQQKVIASTNKADNLILTSKQNMLLTGDLANSGMIISKEPIKLAVMPQGTVSGYLILTHPWQDITQQLANTLLEFLIIQENKYYLFSNNNLQSIKPSNVHKNQETWIFSSQEKLHSKKITLLNTLDKTVYIYGLANTDIAFKPITATLKLIGIVTFILLLPIILVSIWSSNRFVKPMISLQKVAEKIADSGDLSIEIPIQSNDEIGRLARVLNNMTHNLKNAFEKNEKSNEELRLLTENLETRVEERTEELSQALEKLKSAQSQLVQSEKMSSLGQLVAGIAHELNNPISSVHVNTPMLKDYVNDLISLIDDIVLPENAELPSKVIIENLSAKLEDIDYDFLKEDISMLLTAQEDAARRIRDIVLSLRTFSRLDEAEIKSVDLNENIDNTINILRHEIKHRVDIHKDYQLHQNVECFPGEINQVILNILANAAQAIDGKGNIYISTALVNNNCAQICICDDGSGLPQAIIEKVFDPFFTTKEVGVGTGLGLSISYGIIEKHHGNISVENVSPHGAKFTIEIPLKHSIEQG